MFLDSERARLQAAKAVLVKRCDMRRMAMSLDIAQARAGLRGALSGVKAGVAVAEMAVRALTGGKK